MNTENRRVVAARNISFFHRLSARLVKMGLTPNQISVASAVYALLAAAFFIYAKWNAQNIIVVALLLLAVVCVQLRLICNLIDGLMAVEGGLKSKSGELFNDVPDRFSDVFILLGAAYWAGSLDLGWLAGVLAVGTAYVRTLGASLTKVHDFAGPMAKQHRMFLVTLGALGGIVEYFVQTPKAYSMQVALYVIVVGCALTIANRLRRTYRSLENS